MPPQAYGPSPASPAVCSSPSTLAPPRPCCRPCPLGPVRLLSVLMTPPQPGNLLEPPSSALESSLGPRSRPAATPSLLPSQSVFWNGDRSPLFLLLGWVVFLLVLYWGGLTHKS